MNGVPFSQSLVLAPLSRWPILLPEATIQAVRTAPLPSAAQCAKPTAAPRATIVIPTRDNLVFTRLCLESVLANTDGMDYEAVVVDNGSADGTRAYLSAVADAHSQVRAVFLEENRGFAAAVNLGLGLARAPLFVLLNNDTIVPPGWLGHLAAHLDDAKIGLAGPVTNRAGNEAQVEATYRTYGEMVGFARENRERALGKRFDIRVSAMFCTAMRRELYERVGPLDERFEVGLFEDDDYALRVRQAGYRVVCAEDAFVHHFGQASLGVLSYGEYGRLFHANRARWEEKWGRAWQPYQRRQKRDYEEMRAAIRQVVQRVLPAEARVLVISRGDDDLLDFEGRRGAHFPQTSGGVYAGHHPADSAAAIRHLEELRASGQGDYLLVPHTELWWLDHYREFRDHLERHYAEVEDADESCRLFPLRTRR